MSLNFEIFNKEFLSSLITPTWIALMIVQTEV